MTSLATHPRDIVENSIQAIQVELDRLREQVDSASKPKDTDDVWVVSDSSDGRTEGAEKAVRRGHSSEKRAVRQPKPALPDPRLLRRIIELRERRFRFFDKGMLADPAWDMILDLALAHVEFRRISVTSLCIASGVPPTTALRWIRQLVEQGLFERYEDAVDRRRAFISLSDHGVEKVAAYFNSCGRGGITVV